MLGGSKDGQNMKQQTLAAFFKPKTTDASQAQPSNPKPKVARKALDSDDSDAGEKVVKRLKHDEPQTDPIEEALESMATATPTQGKIVKRMKNVKGENLDSEMSVTKDDEPLLDSVADSVTNDNVESAAEGNLETSPIESSPKASPKKVKKTSKKTSPKASPKQEPAKTTSKSTTAAKKESFSKNSTKEAEESASDDDVPATAALISMESPITTSWKPGEKVPYSALCQLFEKIEGTTKRLVIAGYVVQFFKQVIETTPENLLPSLYLCINRLCPEYEGLELGVGETLLMKAVAGATGRTVPAIKKQVEDVGDLGSVAQSSRSGQMIFMQPKPLTIPGVFSTLKELAAYTGNKSQDRKIEKIKGLLVACKGSETKYLIRSMEGKLRIGSGEKTVLVALARASLLARAKGKLVSEEEFSQADEIIKQVYSEMPNYDKIVPVLLQGGIHAVERECKLTPGIPLKPMLAHPTKSISEVLTRFEGIHFTCEWKYDGERAQIHKLEDGSMYIYSRNSENMSAKYPDIMARLHKISNAKSFVLDCEAVAWDREAQRILPFQVLSTRKRKDVAVKDIVVQAQVFAFDLLYLNGEPLIREPLQRRRELLHQHFVEVPDEFSFAKYKDASSTEEIQQFLDESIVGNCEGLMVKTLDKEASYEPSKRSRNWLKVKKDYLSDGASDSLDLVVIGAYHGRGKRAGVYGGFLLACYDDREETYQSICKIGTGFSEEDLTKHTEFFKQHIVKEPKGYYQYSEDPRVKPDVWFEPVQVWEVKCADLSISPVHMAAAGLVDEAKGISLRFPRFIRIRDDKNPEDATNATQVADMFESQAIFQQEKKGKASKEDW